jgi:hypothetical protein
MFVQSYAQVADGQLWDEIRCLYGEEIKEVPLPLLEIRGRPHGRDRHLHRPFEGVLVETGSLVGRSADDNRVYGGATTATGGVTTTLSRRRMPAMEGRRWSTMEGRVAGHCRRRAVRVRVATGGGDVVGTRLREERSGVRKGISGGRVWLRWWELFHRQLVARGIAGRIVTALCDKGVANMSCSGSGNDGCLYVQTGVAKQGVRGRKVHQPSTRWEGVHDVAVARGFELRIATALSDMGVGNNVGRLRVHAGVDERHSLQYEREGTRGRTDRALSRAEVMGIRGRNM